MTRIEKILGKVRRELADLDKTRWSDENLIGLISDAQDDIVYKTNCLYKSITLTTEENKNTYILPDDFRLLRRVSYDNKALKLVTMNYIEGVDENWRTTKGTPVYAIYDNMNRGSIKISPVPENPSTATATEDLPSIDVIYLANPTPVTTTDDELSLGVSYDLGLFYYVVSRALGRDFDAQDINVGNRYAKMYDDEVKRLLAESSKCFIGGPLTCTYQGFV